LVAVGVGDVDPLDYSHADLMEVVQDGAGPEVDQNALVPLVQDIDRAAVTIVPEDARDDLLKGVRKGRFETHRRILPLKPKIHRRASDPSAHVEASVTAQHVRISYVSIRISGVP
jgi:hypothetical protein